MKTFSEYLRDCELEDGLLTVLESLRDSVIAIAAAVRTTAIGKAGTQNVFGEEQLAIDVVSNNIVEDTLRKNTFVGLIASEEMPDEVKIGEGEYAVCFDPLDGSSLIDVNLAVGSIFGIYKTSTFLGVCGQDQLAAMAAVYGPRTTIVLTVKKGVVEFVLNDGGEFVLWKSDIKVTEGKMFAPGNLRACKSRKEYLELVNYWCIEQYTLRYSGGMVPDINQILLKGKGIFAYPGFSAEPDGKLRLLFECAPMSLIMEQAGGESSDGVMPILDKVVDTLDQRTPIFIGSRAEVSRCRKFLSH